MDSPATYTVPTLLTLPAELRNYIYHFIFTSSSPSEPVAAEARSIFQPLELTDFGKSKSIQHVDRTPSDHSPVTRTCRQLYHETNLIYLNTTRFHLTGEYCEPGSFKSIVSAVPQCHQPAIRHIVLTAKTQHLRALNEQWNSVVFGNELLQLDTLTIIPKRPEVHHTAFAEVADLSQSHTLAYILAETLKSLRGVRIVTVRNEGCFNKAIWRLLYSSLVFRLWRWGGRLCGLGFRSVQDEEAFEILCGGTFDGLDECNEKVKGGKVGGWIDVLQEMNRLLGEGGSRDGMDELTRDAGPHN